MTALLLATLLNLSPGIQLADNFESRHVALSEARLPLLFVSDDGPRPSLDAMTREQLAVELRRLDDTRPSLVGPIVLLSVGGVLAIPGIALFVIGLNGLNGGTGLVEGLMLLGGSVLVITGAILLLIGGIKLAMRLVAQGSHAEETDEVRKKIDALDQAPPTAPPPPGPELLPPPPPPPQANLVVPGGLRTVMTF